MNNLDTIEKYANWYNKSLKNSDGRSAPFIFLFDPSENYNVDLHMHSSYSVGKRSVEKILKEAAENDMDYISITDNDTFRGYLSITPEMIEKSGYKGRFIFGAELTTIIKTKMKSDGPIQEKRIEILTYFPDPSKLINYLNEGKFKYVLREYKIIRNLLLLQQKIDIINKLKLTKKPISISDILSLEKIDTNDAESGEKVKPNPIPLSQLGLNLSLTGLSEITLDTLKNFGKPNSSAPCFDVIISIGKDKFQLDFDYFNDKLFNLIKDEPMAKKFFAKHGMNKENYGARYFSKHILSLPEFAQNGIWHGYPSLDEVVDFVRACDGVAVLAHPSKYGLESQNLAIDLIHFAKRHGVDGVEAFHGFTRTDLNISNYETCKSLGLIPTMGSDLQKLIDERGVETRVGQYNGDTRCSEPPQKLNTINLHNLSNAEPNSKKTQNPKQFI